MMTEDTFHLSPLVDVVSACMVISISPRDYGFKDKSGHV